MSANLRQILAVWTTTDQPSHDLVRSGMWHPFSNVYLDLNGNDWKVVVLVVVVDDDDTNGGMVIEEPFSRND